MALLQYKRFVRSPISSLNRLSKTILQTTVAVSGAIGASWGSICLFASIMPRTFLPRFRFFLGGLLGGSFQFLDRTKAGRANSLYAARVSADSLWKVGVKHGWWRGVRGGDMLVFVAALAVLNSVYELRADAIEDHHLKSVVRILRGDLELGLTAKKTQSSERTDETTVLP
jgi:hypothetical protein